MCVCVRVCVHARRYERVLNARMCSHLHARANINSKQCRVLRWAENVATDELPSCFLSGFFSRLLALLKLVVAVEILAQDAQHDHGNHA